MYHPKLWRIKLADIIDGIESTFNERRPKDFGYPYPYWCESGCGGLMGVETYVVTLSRQTLEDPGEEALKCSFCGRDAYDNEGPQRFKAKRRQARGYKWALNTN